MQNALHDFARFRIRVRLQFGLGSWLGLGPGFGQKLANWAGTVLKMRTTFCKLCRFFDKLQSTVVSNEVRECVLLVLCKRLVDSLISVDIQLDDLMVALEAERSKSAALDKKQRKFDQSLAEEKAISER